jgi:competence protein ComEC
MAIPTTQHSLTPARREPSASLSINVWQAPLLPLALVVSAGIVADRYLSVPLAFSLTLVACGVAAWAAVRRTSSSLVPLAYLGVASAAAGAAYHHQHRELFRSDDIGNFAPAQPRPARLRGVLAEEPTINHRPPQSPLESIRREDQTLAVLDVSALRQRDDWQSVTGRARLVVAGHLTGVHAGDEVEAVGRLAAPRGPANPGERDATALLRDQRIRAELLVQRSPAAVTRLAERWPRTLSGWLGVVRGWGQRALADALPAEQAGVAQALLLGDGSTMTNEDWEAYIRTGVIHVLAISGQHLVVLAGFLWLALRLLGIRRRSGALAVGLFLVAYALLAGGRPPVLRSAVMVAVACIAMHRGWPVLSANSFALAWLVVIALNPTDIFGAGCQLSFLSVAVLYWGTRWLKFPERPLDRLVDQSRPATIRQARWAGREVALTYAVGVVIWLAVAPLVAWHYHLVSPVALLLGPPVVLCTSAALLAGFLLLLATLVCWPLAAPFAWVARWSLAACQFLVARSEDWPAGHWYVADLPEWWLWVLYITLFGLLIVEPVRRRWRWVASAGLGWASVGLVAGWPQARPDELRCTFLAVGHGGCMVLETDGRALLYDAGATGGPDVTRRHIAPYLWSRGVRRLDEVFLSHADLDHFNGLTQLLERFTIGLVSCTPTFADKNIEGVGVTLEALRRRGVPVRIVRAGDRLSAGALTVDVLHPPAVGPDGNENARSLVLLLRHEGHRILLTGDLEGPGLNRVLGLPREPVDVLMAPHHGGRSANTPDLAAWAHPKLAVSCTGPPRNPLGPADPYTPMGAVYWGTWPHGAVTIHSRRADLSADTFQTGKRLVLSTPPPT